MAATDQEQGEQVDATLARVDDAARRLETTETLIAELEKVITEATNETYEQSELLSRLQEDRAGDSLLLAEVAEMIGELSDLAGVSQAAIDAANSRLLELEPTLGKLEPRLSELDRKLDSGRQITVELASRQDQDATAWSDSKANFDRSSAKTEELLAEMRANLDQVLEEGKRVRAEVEEARELSTKAVDKASTAADGVDGLRADVEHDEDRLVAIERNISEVSLEARVRENKLLDLADKDIWEVRDRLDALEAQVAPPETRVDESEGVIDIRPPEDWQFERRRRGSFPGQDEQTRTEGSEVS